MKTISILHTIPQSVAPLQKAFDKYKQIKVLHYVDPSIVSALTPDGAPDQQFQRRLIGAALHAAEGADILVLACTLCCRYAERISAILEIPVFEADMPMLLAAAKHADRVGIIATKDSIATQCQEKLRKIAPHPMEAFTQIVPANDRRAIPAAGAALRKRNVEAILLAQLSLADADEELKELPCPIYTSPGFLAEAAVLTATAER